MHIRKNQNGSVDVFLPPLIIASVLTLAFGGFGVWSYLQYQNQKNNVDGIVAEAVEGANAQQEAELRAQFEQDEKKPNKTYSAPSSVGSVKIKYPKTWSAHVDERETGSVPLSAQFHPNFVPADNKTPYATLIEVVDSSYDRELERFDRDIERGVVKASTIEKVDTVGVRLDGEIENDYQGVMVMFPIRDKTLKVWTRSETYKDDFVKIILKSLTFEP